VAGPSGYFFRGIGGWGGGGGGGCQGFFFRRGTGKKKRGGWGGGPPTPPAGQEVPGHFEGGGGGGRTSWVRLFRGGGERQGRGSPQSARGEKVRCRGTGFPGCQPKPTAARWRTPTNRCFFRGLGDGEADAGKKRGRLRRYSSDPPPGCFGSNKGPISGGPGGGKAGRGGEEIRCSFGKFRRRQRQALPQGPFRLVGRRGGGGGGGGEGQINWSKGGQWTLVPLGSSEGATREEAKCGPPGGPQTIAKTSGGGDKGGKGKPGGGGPALGPGGQFG